MNKEEFLNNHAVFRKDSNNHQITHDNRHIATYNHHMLKKFQCYVNVKHVENIDPVRHPYK